MTLLSSEIQGAARLRQVGKIFFDGEQAPVEFESSGVNTRRRGILLLGGKVIATWNDLTDGLITLV